MLALQKRQLLEYVRACLRAECAQQLGAAAASGQQQRIDSAAAASETSQDNRSRSSGARHCLSPGGGPLRSAGGPLYLSGPAIDTAARQSRARRREMIICTQLN